jgi:hypothetical protein
MTIKCWRVGYGTSGHHVPTGPSTRHNDYLHDACYNCKLPIRAPLGPEMTYNWTTDNAYIVLEWP